jgi:hypothetical protein
MMARRFESGFCLVERCRRELPALAAYFGHDSALRAALDELVAAAAKVDAALGQSHRAEAPPEAPDA